jgi:hypothetical protein
MTSFSTGAAPGDPKPISCRLKVELRCARGLASAEIPDWRTPSSPSSLPAGLVGPQR